jgi:hypothetical protein
MEFLVNRQFYVMQYVLVNYTESNFQCFYEIIFKNLIFLNILMQLMELLALSLLTIDMSSLLV